MTSIAALAPRRVLIIDDNHDAADALGMLVEALGGHRTIACDGETALACLAEARPDVIVLDIGLPGIDGYETCRRIRRAVGASVTILALSGWGDREDKQRATEAGFDGHLTKPPDLAQLRGYLRL